MTNIHHRTVRDVEHDIDTYYRKRVAIERALSKANNELTEVKVKLHELTLERLDSILQEGNVKEIGDEW